MAITVSAARVSDTVIRLTVAGTGGAAVQDYRSTAAEVAAGTAPTAGAGRVGNGTIDITVVAGTPYYFFVTVGGVPSNLVGPMTSSTGSGTTRTAKLGIPGLLAQPTSQGDGLEEQTIQAEYALGQLTLAEADLENGDFLPADARYGIVASTWEIVGKPVYFKVPSSGANAVRLTARKVRVWEDSGP